MPYHTRNSTRAINTTCEPCDAICFNEGVVGEHQQKKSENGTAEWYVNNLGFQRNACEPVCRTSMTFTPSHLSFFPGERITRPGCIVWPASNPLPICSKSRRDRSLRPTSPR